VKSVRQDMESIRQDVKSLGQDVQSVSENVKSLAEDLKLLREDFKSLDDERKYEYVAFCFHFLRELLRFINVAEVGISDQRRFTVTFDTSECSKFNESIYFLLPASENFLMGPNELVSFIPDIYVKVIDCLVIGDLCSPGRFESPERFNGIFI